MGNDFTFLNFEDLVDKVVVDCLRNSGVILIVWVGDHKLPYPLRSGLECAIGLLLNEVQVAGNHGMLRRRKVQSFHVHAHKREEAGKPILRAAHMIQQSQSMKSKE
eukprot:GCRY01002245.1.p1 GENE.GCRY01002245.1~~GCRY01002245.1.p1  ORF type:complete len:106 (+),score=6.63 GCRY01002245.1:126-443(+)